MVYGIRTHSENINSDNSAATAAAATLENVIYRERNTNRKHTPGARRPHFHLMHGKEWIVFRKRMKNGREVMWGRRMWKILFFWDFLFFLFVANFVVQTIRWPEAPLFASGETLFIPDSPFFIRSSCWLYDSPSLSIFRTHFRSLAPNANIVFRLFPSGNVCFLYFH